MKRTTYNVLALSAFVALTTASTFAKNTNQDGYTLEQVVMISRHGLRAPLTTGGSTLEKSSAFIFPTWETKGSWLTPKGQVLETYFGNYIDTWLIKNGVFQKDICPKAEDVKVYANSKQRTIATGEFFAAGAFPGCNIPVEHREELDKMDYTFSPVIRDGSDQFKKSGLAAMQEEASKNGIDGMNSELKPAFDLLSNVIDFKNSEMCKADGRCDINEIPTTLQFVYGKEPGVSGPLRLGTIISDAFILQYYDGYPMNKVAWGKIKNNEEWLTLAKIKDKYGELLFGAPLVAKHVAKPLTDYINKTLTQDNQKKLTMLIGHDSNVVSVLSALDVKPYVLPNTFENTPIGGKVALERWTSPDGKQLLKMEYIYQSSDQIRNQEQLTLVNPAQHVILEMEGCPIDNNGFCSFDIFKKKLASL